MYNNNIIKKILAIPDGQNIAEIIKGLEGTISQEKVFKTEVINDEQEKEIVINYSPIDYIDNATILSLAAGLPNEEFERAERIYKSQLSENGLDYKYNLIGYSLGGSLSQYSALMSEGFINNYQVITYNSIGLEKCFKFNGNEFLGYQMGLLYYLKKLLDDNNTMDMIYYDLLDEQLIKYDNISTQYRKGKKINREKIKNTIGQILVKRLEIDHEKAESIIEKNFNPLIIERKMRLIDRYKDYQLRLKKEEKKDHLINYIHSDNLLSLFLEQAGSTYLVDKNLKKTIPAFRKEIFKEKIKDLEKDAEDSFKTQTDYGLDLFQPYLCLANENNSSKRKINNRLGILPQMGNVTNKLSLDYLQSLIKDIIIELHKKDKKILKVLFKLSRRGYNSPFLELIKDRLRYSIKLQRKITESKNIFQSRYFKENPELLTEEDKIYPLAQAALDQIENSLNESDLQDLYKWEIKGEGIELILCPKIEEQGAEDKERLIEYHSSDSTLKFDNQEERLKIDCQDPSNNRIYGSVKHSRYSAKNDNEYFLEEDDLYQFNNTKGVGFSISSLNTSPEKIIKIDTRDISGEYQEKDREEADIGDRTKTLRDTYYGDNIILKNKKQSMGELSGDLLFYYGPEKKDELIIEGFVNGDYGIQLIAKAEEKSDDNEPVSYTEYRVRFDPFEFTILEEFEINRVMYEHSTARIKGVISTEDAEEYSQYLDKNNPCLIVKYKFEEKEKHLFKGIITEHQLIHQNQVYYLELEAVSYSVLLERERRGRIYQNIGSTYQDLFDILSKANENFSFTCSDGVLKSEAFVTEEFPVILQYRENDWDFIKRIASYIDSPLIVNDLRDDSEKINIQIGHHNTAPVDLNNSKGEVLLDTDRKNIKYRYYRIKKYHHIDRDDLFEIGKKTKFKFGDLSEEGIETIIIKNRIYIESSRLHSDLTLAREADIQILNKKREFSIAGKSFSAEVVEVDNKHRAKLNFTDMEDDFDISKAYSFPIDQFYIDSFFAPEVGDIVDVMFKSDDEKNSAVKSSVTYKKKEVDRKPEEKILAVTPEEYQIMLDNNCILISGKKAKNIVKLENDKILYQMKFDNIDNEISIDKKEIVFRTDKSKLVLDDSKSEVNVQGTKMNLSDKGIDFG